MQVIATPGLTSWLVLPMDMVPISALAIFILIWTAITSAKNGKSTGDSTGRPVQRKLTTATHPLPIQDGMTGPKANPGMRARKNIRKR